jgi:hypothetical protein
MALKYKDVETKERQEKQAAEDARWKGPWGEIIPVEQKHVRFVREVHGVQECWSYPYETLVRQVFKKSEPEEIEILAGGDTITIRGHGLEEFLDTLEKRHLVRVEQRTVRFAASEPNGRCVIEIKIEPSRA